MNNKTLAIIPARGGSKRIPRKNIKPFLGIPIIKYSIDAAIKTNCFDEIMVSTDDKEIADISIGYGASVPFFRSDRISNDESPLVEAFTEVILNYEKKGKEFEYLCCILPTAPLISSKRILEGFNLLKSTGADSVIPVTRFSYPIQRALRIESGCLKMIWPENANKMSHVLEPAYHDAGQFYWLRINKFLEQKNIYCKYTVPLEVPEIESQDIDTPADWEFAEYKYKLINMKA